MATSKLSQSLASREILELVQEDLLKVEREICRESAAPVEIISDIGAHLHDSGGKRLRPILLLLASHIAGESSDAAIRMAAVVEMIHTATLVHDDVIDVADTRRGRPSANVIWGNQRSVLAGNWIYMQAFQIALRERNFAILDLLLNLTQMMVEGELLQLERLRRIDISEADYMELVDRKTASLFSTCARLGALVGGADEDTERRLGEFAWNLGIAFQLTDDILDFASCESILGKPVGNDLREGKVTLPLIYALLTAPEKDRAAVQRVLEQGSYQDVSFRRILDIIDRQAGLSRARERAQSFADRARAILADVAESPYQRALLAVTDLVTDREF